MAPPVKKGGDAEWNWGRGKGAGKIVQVFKQDVTKTIKGTKVTRHASPEKPAVVIRTAKAKLALKSVTEIKVK